MFRQPTCSRCTLQFAEEGSLTLSFVMAIDPTVYAAVKKDLLELIRNKRCNPRLAWHDSGTYDKVRS